MLFALAVILSAVPTTSRTPDASVKPAPATVDFSCKASDPSSSKPPDPATLRSITPAVYVKPRPANVVSRERTPEA